MIKIFLDTSGILALVNKRDFLHEKAKKVNSTLLAGNVHFYTTDYVLVEVENALAKNKKLAVKTLKNLQKSENTDVVKITDNPLSEAL